MFRFFENTIFRLQMMVNGYSANESGRLDDDTVRHLVADLKQIFPGIGEQIILGKIYQV